MDVGYHLIIKLLKGLDKDLKTTVEASITSNMVGDERRGKQFDFLMGYWQKYGKLPTLDTFLTRYSSEEDINSPEPVEYYIEAVREQYLFNQVRKIKDVIQDKVETVQAEKIMQEILSIGRESLVKIKPLSDIDFSSTISHRLKNYKDYIGMKGQILGYETGIEYLDKSIGGINKGELITIHGRPGSLKSRFILLLALYLWLKDLKILFVSREMSPRRLIKIIDSYATKVKYGFIKHGFPDTKEYNEFKKRLEQFEDKHEFIVSGTEGSDFTTDTVRAKIREVKPDVCFVDGTYMMQVAGYRGGKDWERITAVTREMKQLTMVEDIPIIQTTQTGRGKQGEEFHSRDKVMYSDSFLQDSDVLIHVRKTWDEVRKRYTNVQEVSFDKVRDDEGEGNKFYIEWNFEDSTVDIREKEENYNIDIELEGGDEVRAEDFLKGMGKEA
jgi:replicative DNA helicase